MAVLTTHALDLAHGKPASGLTLRLKQDGKTLLETITNSDGRCDEPLGTELPAGVYEIHFEVAAYYGTLGIDSPFLDTVPVRFNLTAGEKYHVPLTFTPWAYSTYRGS